MQVAFILKMFTANTASGRCLKFCGTLFDTGAKLYQASPSQLSRKIQEHDLQVLPIDSTDLGYFLIEVKNSQNQKATKLSSVSFALNEYTPM